MKKVLSLLLVICSLGFVLSSCYSTQPVQTTPVQTTPKKAVDSLNEDEYRIYKAVISSFANPTNVRVLLVGRAGLDYSYSIDLLIEGPNQVGGLVQGYFEIRHGSTQLKSISGFSDAAREMTTVSIGNVNRAIKEYCEERGL